MGQVDGYTGLALGVECTLPAAWLEEPNVIVPCPWHYIKAIRLGTHGVANEDQFPAGVLAPAGSGNFGPAPAVNAQGREDPALSC